jgi:hypothetical protein
MRCKRHSIIFIFTLIGGFSTARVHAQQVGVSAVDQAKILKINAVGLGGDSHLLTGYFNDPSAGVRIGALNAIGSCRIENAEDYIAIVAASRRDPDFDARAASLNSLRALTISNFRTMPGVGVSRATAQQIVVRYQTADPHRGDTALAIGHLQSANGGNLPEAAGIFKSAIEDPDRDVQLAALDAIGTVMEGYQGQFAQMVSSYFGLAAAKFLDEAADESIRSEAGLVFYVNAPNRGGVDDVWRKGEKSSSLEIRRMSAMIHWAAGVYKMEDNAVPSDEQLIDAMRSRHHWVRVASWGAFETTRSPQVQADRIARARKALLAAFDDAYADVQADAALELGGIDPPATIQWNWAVLHLSDSARAQPLSSARAPAPEVADILIQLKSDDPQARLGVVRALPPRLVRSPQIIEWLSRHLNDEDQQLRQAAHETLQAAFTRTEPVRATTLP